MLDVYGFAVVDMRNGVLKVVRSKDAKMAAVPVASDAEPGNGDEVVTRVVSVKNVSARDLAPYCANLMIMLEQVVSCIMNLPMYS